MNVRELRQRWASTPHIRPGDPCYLCGEPMADWSRTSTTPSGRIPHRGLGLCARCHPHRAEIPDDGIPPTGGRP